MSVDRDEFQQWMNEGNNAAWDQNWAVAIEAYNQALKILPDDPDAHVNLGLALLNDGQLDRALKVYKRAYQLAPDDPEPLERSADVLERMGQLREAAQQYVQVAEVYLKMRDLEKAISNWERATQLTPGLVGVHARLAQAYERIGDKKRAMREYLTLAFNFRRLNDVEKAIRAVERGLRLDANNPQLLNALRALKAGGEVILPEDMVSRGGPAKAAAYASDFQIIPDESIDSLLDVNPLGPIGEALTESLTLLAAHVVESGLSPYVAPTLQGLEYQRQELYEEAVEAYEQAIQSGLRHPSLSMCLGGLLILLDRPDEALKYLGEAVMDPVLAAGALHATGLAHYKMGDQLKTATFLTRSLRAVDTSLAINPMEVEELSTVYDRLLAALPSRKPEALERINERFVNLLSGEDWKSRIAETRRRLEETLRGEGDQGMIEILEAKGSEEVAEAVTNIQRYIRQNLYDLAMDEAQHAVEKSPHYLPVHVFMAEILMRQQRIRYAIDKYNIVARAYLLRGENGRAAAILGEVLEMAPLDVEVRLNLIDLLEGENRMNEALDQYIHLANTYQQLGDFDKASQTFSAAERVARQISAPVSKAVEIKHFLADIHQMRLNTRQAQRICEEILELMPEDQKALRLLVDTHFTQGNTVEAIKRLDVLLGVYAKHNEIDRIVRILEEFVRTNAQEPALRSRLASIYRKLGRVREAIEQLDALGEIQLDAGQNREAANTIRQIIALGPERVEDYKRLLSQLM